MKYRSCLHSWLAQTDYSRSDYLPLAIISALALALRLLRARDGLPYMHFWDEPALAFKALDMLRTGDLNPHVFNYGSLMMYLNLVVDWLRALTTGGIGQLQYGSATGFDWYISNPSYIYWNRALTGLLGTLTVIIVYLLAQKASGRLAAIASALLLAVLGIHIEHSAYITTDAPMTFFVWLAVLCSSFYIYKQQPGWLLVSLAAGGLATSVKYNAALCLLVPFVAFLLSLKGEGYRRWLWLALPVVPAAAFFAGSPFALFDFQKFINDALYEARHYAEIGHGWAHVQPGWPHIQLQSSALLQNSGRVAAVIALIGLPFAFRRRAYWPWLVFLLTYFTFMTRMRVSFHRNFLVLYPAISLCFGLGVTALWHFARDVKGKSGRWLSPVFLALVAAFLGYKSIRTAQANWRIWNTPETRTQAVLAVKEYLPGTAPARIGVAEELRIHPDDLAKLPGEITVLPYTQLLQHAGDYDLLLGYGRLQGSNSSQRETAAALTGIIEQIPAEQQVRIGSAPLYLEILSVDPQVVLVTGTRGLSEFIEFP